MEYWLEYFLKYLSVCLPLLIEPDLRNSAVFDYNRQESDDYDGVGGGHLVDHRR